MSPRGGTRPGAGRPVTTERARGPRTTIRWSAEEYAEIVTAAVDQRFVAAWARGVLLAVARKVKR